MDAASNASATATAKATAGTVNHYDFGGASLDMLADLPPDLLDFDLMNTDFDESKPFDNSLFFDQSLSSSNDIYLQSRLTGEPATDALTQTQLSGGPTSVPHFSDGPPPAMGSLQQQQHMPVPLPISSVPGMPSGSLQMSLDTRNTSTQQDAVPQKQDNPANSRKRIPPEKTLILETSFQNNPKPDRATRDSLARETGLPVRNIQVSFRPL